MEPQKEWASSQPFCSAKDLNCNSEKVERSIDISFVYVELHSDQFYVVYNVYKLLFRPLKENGQERVFPTRSIEDDYHRSNELTKLIFFT